MPASPWRAAGRPIARLLKRGLAMDGTAGPQMAPKADPKLDRSYADAITALNTLQTNSAVLRALRLSGSRMNAQAIPEMVEWCRKIGYEPAQFDRLNAIHIAGTKGKGSTSAFVSSILAQYRSPTAAPTKIGLYTSPHLRFVRERIRIDDTPLSEPMFAKYFFETWDRLEESARTASPPPDARAKPVYFRYLTLMALHTYMAEHIDTAIIECGIGGEHDSTNILLAPTVTAITSLGIDHTAVLGNTIAEIAWHKAGIMKAGAPAFTAPQPAAAMAVLRARAAEKGVSLCVVDRHPQLARIRLGLAADFQKTNASLAIEVAAAHLRALGHVDVRTYPVLPDAFVRGLELVRWPGRCETRAERSLVWHLDGGHTLESIRVAAEWFAECCAELDGPQAGPGTSAAFARSTQSATTSAVLASGTVDGATTTAGSTASPRSTTGSDPPKTSAYTPSAAPSTAAPRILLFNQQTRAGVPLLRELHAVLASALHTPHPFSHAVFCSNVTFAATGYRPDLVSLNTTVYGDGDGGVDLCVQRELARGWGLVDGGDGGDGDDVVGAGEVATVGRAEVHVVRTVEEGVRLCRDVADAWVVGADGRDGERVKVLVTGSVHLVGGVLEVLESEVGAGGG